MTPAARRRSARARATRARKVARAALHAACRAAGLRLADVVRCPKVPRHVVVRLSAATALRECGANPNVLAALRVDSTRATDPVLVEAARVAARAVLAKQAAELAALADLLRRQHEADTAKARRLKPSSESRRRWLHRHRSDILREIEALGYRRDDIVRALGYSHTSLGLWSRLAKSRSRRSRLRWLC